MEQPLTTPLAEARPGVLYHAAFAASLGETSRVCAEVSTLATERAGPDWAGDIDLGLTEALSNIVRHGYQGAPEGRISLTCVEDAGDWCVRVLDQGHAIPRTLLRAARDHTFEAEPDDIAALPEGGMGLALMHRCFDRIDYDTDDAWNRLSLTKHLPAEAT